MAKKKSVTKKSSTPKKPSMPAASKPAAGKPATKPASKKPPKQHDHEHDHDEEEVELDETESKAVDLVLDSADLRNALETEVNTVVTQAVRKIFKAHGTSLTADQAQNVAMVLFGD